MKTGKIDLDLLKKLVSELESVIAGAEAIKAEEKDKNAYIIEMSKATGLAAGVMTEAGLLVGDIHALLSQGGVNPSKNLDVFSQLLGDLKGSGKVN